MSRRFHRRITLKPVLSAFILGVLVAVGIDPGQMLFETAVSTFGIYLRFIAVILLVIAIFLSYNWLIDALRRSRSAYRMVGILGVVSVVMAFIAGFLVFQWEKAALALLVATIVWVAAQAS